MYCKLGMTCLLQGYIVIGWQARYFFTVNNLKYLIGKKSYYLLLKLLILICVYGRNKSECGSVYCILALV